MFAPRSRSWIVAAALASREAVARAGVGRYALHAWGQGMSAPPFKPEEVALGRAAIALGMITREQLDSALAERARAAESGAAETLDRTLVRMQLLDEEKISALSKLTPRPSDHGPTGVTRMLRAPTDAQATPEKVREKDAALDGSLASGVAPPPAGPAARRSSSRLTPPSSSASGMISFAPGAQIGAYVLERELGRGGMGIVFAALHTETNERVAIKLLRDPGRKAMVDRFVRETQAVGRLDHKSIVKLVDSGTAGDLPWYAMEFVEGQPLDDILSEGKLNLKERIRALRDVCRAVGHAHERGIVHRDLKPANVLITKDLVAKVTDFGLAKIEDDENKLTKTGAAIGTPHYMSPEQVAGKKIDRRTDIWSLGVLVYEIVSNTTPFGEGQTADIYFRIGNLPPKPLEGDPQLARVAMKCLEKDPDDRYQTADELAEDLQRWIDGRPVSAASGPSVGRRLRRLSRAKLAALAGAPLALIALAAGFVVLRPRLMAPIVVGMIPDRRMSTERLKSMAPFQDVLASITNRRVELAVGESYQDTIDHLIQGHYVLVKLGGASYVDARKRDGKIAPLVRSDADSHYHSVVLAGATSGLTKLDDLRGKRIAFSDPLSTSGYVVPATELMKAGLDPREAFQSVVFVGSQDDVVASVAKGLVDAGAVGEATYTKLLEQRKVSPDAVRVVATSPEYADNVWVASAALDEAQRFELVKSLVLLDASKPEQALALGALGAQRLVPADDSDYVAIRERVEQLRAIGMFPGKPVQGASTPAPPPPPPPTASGGKLAIGLIPDRQATAERLAKLEPFAKFLERVTGRSVELSVGDSYAETVEGLVNGRFGLVQLGGASYVVAKEQANVALVAQRDQDKRTRSVVIARDGSGVAKLADLATKRVSFVDPLSTSGYVVPAAMLLQAGVDPKRGRDAPLFAGSHDEAIAAVAKGLVDAAACSESAWKSALEKKPELAAKIKVVATSEEFADNAWVASPSLDEPTRAAIAKAFLALDGARADDKPPLEALHARALVLVRDEEYTALRGQIDALRVKGLFAALAPRDAAPSSRPLAIGLIPDRQATAERLKKLEPLARAIERAIARKVELKIGESYAEVVDGLVRGDFALTQLGGASFVAARERDRRLTPLFQRDVDRAYRSVVIAAASSGVSRLEQLKGKRIAFVDPLSTSGYVVPASDLLAAGLHPRDDFDQVFFLGSHDEVVAAVTKGLCDAGACSESAWRSLADRGKVRADKVKVVATSAEFSDNLWVASPSLDAKTRDELVRALTSLDATSDAAALEALGAARMVPVVESAYDALKERIEKLKAIGLFPGKSKPW